jgi:hypothetical protein
MNESRAHPLLIIKVVVKDKHCNIFCHQEAPTLHPPDSMTTQPQPMLVYRACRRDERENGLITSQCPMPQDFEDVIPWLAHYVANGSKETSPFIHTTLNAPSTPFSGGVHTIGKYLRHARGRRDRNVCKIDISLLEEGVDYFDLSTPANLRYYGFQKRTWAWNGALEDREVVLHIPNGIPSKHVEWENDCKLQYCQIAYQEQFTERY